MRGRKPIPNSIKILTGNPGKRPIMEGPEPGGIPTCPDHLSDEARAEWNRVAPELLACGLLTSVDRAALAAYCTAWSRWVQAEKKLLETGPIIKAKSGYPMMNPYLVVANAAMKQMKELLVEFGMSPSSRRRVGMSAQPHDELEEFLAQHQG
jgi:P27 family predicted phage terminase small subunit